MPTDIMPLATSGERARATAALHAATQEEDPLTAAVLVDVLDSVCGAVLRPAGVEDDEARHILAILWGDRG